ncbi:trypsin-like serine protease, partial [Myxococcota bacterium]|nr:trypsin-like serine protease [Myxococcota bacterium]
MAPQTRAHRLCLLALLWACAEPPELAQQQLQIINGEPSVAGAFPTVGALLATVQTYQGPRGGFSCTGTLIAPDVVLTAGHCIEPPQGVQEMTLYFSLSLDVADFGQPDLTLPPRTSRVRRAQPHPGWQGTQSLQPRGLGQPNDLALLFLETPFLDAPTSILSDPLGAATLRRDASVLIVGYGQRDPEAGDMMGPQPPAGVQYQAWSVIKEISAVEMQIGDEFPTPQKCHGDSGGPTFMDFDDGRAPSRRLIGVTSRGYEDSADCWIGGVDTRVDYYHAWISEAMVNACRDGTRAGCVEGGAPPIPEVTPPDV